MDNIVLNLRDSLKKEGYQLWDENERIYLTKTP
jgi:hypothetical protein